MATIVIAVSGLFWLSFAATIGIAVGMALQNTVGGKLLPFYIPHAVSGVAGWIGGLGASS
ncbi:hypothetical protein H0B56_15110 [Haloechinothrix sp. YIM 98757]|uniref:Uncharacterized protein n=1 Tax=Haloechinothrix aidingensis TaxID=2752311 RepID=A0A838ACI3_9PSEU|nr:hypothetical protein [Haloechinothrix aidingensis]MBA0126878.1 hypothetical protein [Haloechinothrix aidingensis]